MINTTIKVVSSDGIHSSEETVVMQSAGSVSSNDDRQNHVNSFPIDNIQYAIKVTIDGILDDIDDEERRRNAIRSRLDGNDVELPGTGDTNV